MRSSVITADYIFKLYCKKATVMRQKTGGETETIAGITVFCKVSPKRSAREKVNEDSVNENGKA